jgi:predicted HicB family RNase H-like nuclease
MAREPTKPPSAVKTAIITVRIDPELKERARAAAAADWRTLSQWIELLIRDALERKGGT